MSPPRAGHCTNRSVREREGQGQSAEAVARRGHSLAPSRQQTGVCSLKLPRLSLLFPPSVAPAER